MSRLHRHAACLCLLAGLCSYAQTQPDPRHIDATSLGDRIDLSPAWLFSPTDSPDNASPTLDDSAWTPISTARELPSYGFRNIPIGWYRLHIHLSPQPATQPHNLAITTAALDPNYQLFLNGTLIGQSGSITDRSYAEQAHLRSFPIPNSLLADAHGDLVLALRIAIPAMGPGGPGSATPIPTSSVFLESRSAVPQHRLSAFSRDYTGEFVVLALFLLVGCLTLTLFLALRDDPVYLPLAIHLLALAISLVFAGGFLPGPSAHAWYAWPARLCEGLANAALIEFVRVILRIRRSRALFCLEIVAILAPLVPAVFVSGVSVPATAFYAGFGFYFLPILILFLLLPVLLLIHMRRSLDARLLLPAVLLAGAQLYREFFQWIAYFLHLTPHTPNTFVFHLGTITVSLDEAGRIAFAIAILFFIVLRTIRVTRERTRAASEIAAAATVQNLLLARSAQPTPGFLVDTVYLPASEVGGDFFLISPDPSDESLIAIIGDVSGKGLPAAMRVAMILGALRREPSRNPSDILASLNSALVAQGDTGFTTACCIHILRDGRFAVANAGHIAPYLSGSEIDTPPALPLGLAPFQTYTAMHGRVHPGQRLVLMSDGVPEARNPKGTLYGFDALPTLTLQPATDIAHTAQTFGQEDDITVLTLAVL